MYVAFLRGINVSGKNKIDMKSLVVHFQDLKFTEVSSYLNSGNLIFDTELEDISDISQIIERMIFEMYGLKIEVIIRSEESLKLVIEAYTFNSSDGKNRYVTLCKGPHDKALADALDRVKTDDDQIAYQTREINMYIPSGAGKSKLSNNYIEKKGHVVATTRNMNTLEKIMLKMTKA